MKYYILFFIFLLANLNIFSYKNDSFYYTITEPKGWNINKESENDVLFYNSKETGFIEILIFELSSADNKLDLLNDFKKRFNMKGKFEKISFCSYEAYKGVYSLNLDGADVNMDLVIFRDNYYYYLITGYAYKKHYNKIINTIWDSINSFELHYDNNVTYKSSDSDKSATRKTEETKKYDDSKNYNNKNNQQNKKNQQNRKKKQKEEPIEEYYYRDDTKKQKIEETKNTESTVKEYSLTVEWDKYRQTYKFKEPDLYKAIKEVDKIASVGWLNNYGIDGSDSDYNYLFWKSFYQDMYNKNHLRVKSIADFFASESDKNGWSAFKLAENVMKSIQVIPYQRPMEQVIDSSRGANQFDYFTPNEVGWYNMGDCDTKSLFMIMILKQLGFDVGVYYSYDYAHAMVGLNVNASGAYKEYNGKKYYFIESTYPGWKIGDIPPEMKNTKKWRLIHIK